MNTLYRWQVYELARASIKARYRGAFAGFFWVILSPILLFGVQSYAFRYVMRVQLEHYTLFLLAGLFPWVCLVQSLEMTVNMFVSSAALLKSFPVSPLALLLGQLIDNGFNFLIGYLLILFPVALYFNHLNLSLLLLPICVAILFLGIFSMAWLLATLNVFYRDIRFVLNFVLSVMFFLTPIFYPPTYVPNNVRWLLYINPFYHLIHPFQVAVFDFSWGEFLYATQAAFLVSLIALLLAAWYWSVKQNAFYNSI